MKPRGELAMVLHTHMPYVEGGGAWPPTEVAEYMDRHGVDFETALEQAPNRRDPEGFGTWPFGEEWLWEAIATSYLPLLETVLGRAPITLSLTPVLCDQLEQPDAMERCLTFLTEIRPETHRRDIDELGSEAPALVAELERSQAEYAQRAASLQTLGPNGLLNALGEHATWTSAATHAVLPLVATDAGLSLQIQTGVASHRRRFGQWNGGFWLPECAHAPWLDEHLADAGVHHACVELTNQFGLGDKRHLSPTKTEDGPTLWPIDREIISLAWSDSGYPASPAYRDYHAHTRYRHRIWANDGTPYDPAAAGQQAAADARDFVARTKARVSEGGVCVCALDTELLGHWWYEGITWLGAVIDEAARQRLTLTTLDEALERHRPSRQPPPISSTWGEGGDLRTWSGPRVADIAWQARTAELHMAAGANHNPRAARELLALQSSDWAFLSYHGTAGDYPTQRAGEHRQRLEQALTSPDQDPALRGLAPDLIRPLV